MQYSDISPLIVIPIVKSISHYNNLRQSARTKYEYHPTFPAHSSATVKIVGCMEISHSSGFKRSSDKQPKNGRRSFGSYIVC